MEAQLRQDIRAKSAVTSSASTTLQNHIEHVTFKHILLLVWGRGLTSIGATPTVSS